MNKDKQLEAGFTFIETIVTITIMAIIVLALYSLLDIGFSFWDYVDNSHWSYSELQISLGRLAKDLRSTFYRTPPEGFSESYPFTANMYQVSFYARNFDSGEIEKFSYHYSPSEQILYIQQKGKQIPLLKELARWNFYYYNSQHGYWDNYWDSKDKKQPPGVVRIEFAFKSSTKEFSFDFPIYIQQKGLSGR